jgi:hypothetical protein
VGKELRRLLTDEDSDCQRVLEEVKLATACNDSYHDCYLKVYRLIQDRDKTMARAFDDLRRSTALMRLVNVINEGLLTDEELKQFSQELQSRKSISRG